jgi:hypothetical protein
MKFSRLIATSEFSCFLYNIQSDSKLLSGFPWPVGIAVKAVMNRTPKSSTLSYRLSYPGSLNCNKINSGLFRILILNIVLVIFIYSYDVCSYLLHLIKFYASKSCSCNFNVTSMK